MEIAGVKKNFRVVVAGFPDSVQASRFMAELKEKNFTVSDWQLIRHDKIFRIASMPFSNFSEASAFRGKYKSKLAKDAWISNN